MMKKMMSSDLFSKVRSEIGESVLPPKIGAFIISVYQRAVYGPESSMGHAWIVVC